MPSRPNVTDRPAPSPTSRLPHATAVYLARCQHTPVCETQRLDRGDPCTCGLTAAREAADR